MRYCNTDKVDDSVMSVVHMIDVMLVITAVVVLVWVSMAVAIERSNEHKNIIQSSIVMIQST